MAQWAITCVLLGCMILNVDSSYDSGSNSDALGVLLIVLNLTVVALAVVAALTASDDERSDENEEEEEETNEKDHDDNETGEVIVVGDEKVKDFRPSAGIEMNPIHNGTAPVSVISVPAPTRDQKVQQGADSDDEYE